jgi:hypothetical protein
VKSYGNGVILFGCVCIGISTLSPACLVLQEKQYVLLSVLMVNASLLPQSGQGWCVFL